MTALQKDTAFPYYYSIASGANFEDICKLTIIKPQLSTTKHKQYTYSVMLL